MRDDMTDELRALVHDIGPENIWRPVCDAQGYELVQGKGHCLESLPEVLPSHMNFQGKSVVDLGCNVGTFVCRAARAGAVRAVGIDCDERLVRCAQILASQDEEQGVDFMVRDFNDFPEEKFDVAMMFDIIGNTTIGAGKMHDFLQIMENWASSDLVVSLKPRCTCEKHFKMNAQEFSALFPSRHTDHKYFYPVREAVDYLGVRGWKLAHGLPDGHETSGMKTLLHFVRSN